MKNTSSLGEYSLTPPPTDGKKVRRKESSTETEPDHTKAGKAKGQESRPCTFLAEKHHRALVSPAKGDATQVSSLKMSFECVTLKIKISFQCIRWKH